MHLLQIWILPERRGIKPEYEQKSFPAGKFQLVASPDGAEGSLKIHQDAKLFAGSLRNDDSVQYDLQPGRYAWLQVLRGSLTLNGQSLATGDGVAVSNEAKLGLEGTSAAEVMLFDLP